MSDCIFCKIIRNEIPSHTLYEDEATRAFLDIYPATDGHVVVIHKRHEEKITEYGRDELADLFGTVTKIAKALEEEFATPILSIGINHGEPAGVHHAHVHLMPRFAGDGGGIMQELPGKKTSQDVGEVAKRLKNRL
jgi:histidine triad (HIT) family protein